MINPATVTAAAQRLKDIANHTPVITSRTLNQICGNELFLKCENFQRVGAFKFRGAYNAISRLSATEKAAGVITHSSGNHAQGVALAAQLLGIKATIVMPANAPAVKRAATLGYGAEVVDCAAIDREKVTADLIDQHGYTLIHSYDNPHIIAGQGTAALELFAEVGQLDALFVPVGGGGLISGSALAAALKSPGCRVVGVEPETAADANRSWRQGTVHTLEQVPDTIADGLRVRYIGGHNLAVMQQYVHDMTTVSEADILQTLEFVWSRLKIVIEPSSAVALAPLFTGQYPLAGKRVGVILSGGNVNVPGCGFFHQEKQGPEAITPSPSPSPHTPHPNPPPPSPDPQPRILVCDEMDEEALVLLRATAVIDIHLHPTPDELMAKIGNYQALIVGPQTRITGQLIEYGYNLRAIGYLSPRLDRIDVSTARALGIDVINAPDRNAVAIADHTLTRLLHLSSRFGDGRLAGKTLGLIGFGQVGQQVARRARAFDMHIIVNQPRLTPELALSVGAQPADMLDLLAQADFVSLHVPFKKETETIIAARELAVMKPGACLINSGHTNLVDETALLNALNQGQIAGAALSSLPPQAEAVPVAAHAVRRHERVQVEPHVTYLISDQQREQALAVARKISQRLQQTEMSEALSLELVPVEQVVPHEEIDDKRVARLMERLEEDGRLVNPPITTFWKGKYVILDGATRFTSFRRLGYPHLIVQVVPPDQAGFELHTWYHVISGERPFSALREYLAQIEGLELRPLETADFQRAFADERALCYFLDREGNATLALVQGEDDHPTGKRLTLMNQLVAGYTKWGAVERTLLTDRTRLLAQFPQMTAVAIFPQFTPETVFEVASRGEFLPAGLTRFLIPGRILRLNADLERLKRDEPLAEKRAWFNRFLADKLARSRLRYYQEPVILLDE
jgi:threo-3-hydroxy-L-aspartate ammonia-lyase